MENIDNKYDIVDGTAIRKGTSPIVRDIKLRFIHRRTRLRLYLGDPTTGRDWDEQYDVEGAIGRTGGRLHTPILLANARSIGGGEILTQNIVKIRYANKKQGGVLYQHPNYHKEG